MKGYLRNIFQFQRRKLNEIKKFEKFSVFYLDNKLNLKQIYGVE